MPRQVLNQRTGEVTEYPDGTSDEQILAPLQAKAVQSPFGIAAGLARSSLEQYLNRPQSTLPGLGAKDVMGLTPEQVTNTQNMIQQSNMQNQQMSFQEKARQRHETQVALEQEKDRQQQIKLQSMQFKNQEAARKYEEDKYNARLKEETIRKEADASRPKAADYQLIQQADGAYARVDKLTGVVEPIALQGRMPQPKGGAGGAGAGKASDWDKITAEDGSVVYVNALTQEVRRFPDVKVKQTGSGGKPIDRPAIVQAYVKLTESFTDAEAAEYLRLQYPGNADVEAVISEMARIKAGPVDANADTSKGEPGLLGRIFGPSNLPVSATPAGNPIIPAGAPFEYGGKPVTGATRVGIGWKLELADGSTTFVKGAP